MIHNDQMEYISKWRRGCYRAMIVYPRRIEMVPMYDWEKQVWHAFRYNNEELAKTRQL
jgi:hypothetical protein